MNTKPSEETLTLPEPDPDNITVLTHNLPNKPILPWSHYDSPWQEAPVEAQDTLTEPTDQPVENTEQLPSADASEVEEPQPTDALEQQSELPIAESPPATTHELADTLVADETYGNV